MQWIHGHDLLYARTTMEKKRIQKHSIISNTIISPKLQDCPIQRSESTHVGFRALSADAKSLFYNQVGDSSKTISSSLSFGPSISYDHSPLLGEERNEQRTWNPYLLGWSCIEPIGPILKITPIEGEKWPGYAIKVAQKPGVGVFIIQGSDR